MIGANQQQQDIHLHQADTFKKFFDENTGCFECGQPAKGFISINNAVALCDKCAEIHRNFGEDFSRVKGISEPGWTDADLMIIANGGNSRARDFFDSYNIGRHTPMAYKYKTRAGFFYRRKLKHLIEGKPEPLAPGQDTALEMIENDNLLDNLKENINESLTKVGSLISDAYTSAKTTIQDPNFSDHMKEKATALKDQSIALASKGLESVKDGLSNLTGVIKEKIVGEPKPVEMTEVTAVNADHFTGEHHQATWKETALQFKDKAVDMASKGVTAAKEGIIKAVDFFQGSTQEGEGPVEVRREPVVNVPLPPVPQNPAPAEKHLYPQFESFEEKTTEATNLKNEDKK